MRLEEIPVKLRCAGCNKLAMNAFRMPCCDQCVCETCKKRAYHKYWDPLADD